MEYMRIEGFLGGAVSRLINKGIESKFGYKPEINLSSLNLKTVDEEKLVQLDVRLNMSQSDFNKLMEEVTK